MQLNELHKEMEGAIPQTDCRLRPDIRAMENGDIGEERHRRGLFFSLREVKGCECRRWLRRMTACRPSNRPRQPREEEARGEAESHAQNYG